MAESSTAVSPHPEETSSHRVLLTGATGFIGQHLTRQLLDAGHEVLAVVRPARRHVPIDTRATIVRADLLDRVAIGDAVSRATAVIHVAGAVRGATKKDFVDVNVDGVKVMRDAVLQATQRGDPSRPFLLMSSLAASIPDLSEYSASKRAGEELVTGTPELRWTAIRPPAVYGPGDRELRPLLQLLHLGIAIIPGNPQQRLSFIHVSDLAAACVSWLAHHQLLEHRVFTIDDGRPGGYDWPAILDEVCARRLIRLVIPPPLLEVLGRVNGWLADRLGRAPMLSPGKVRELMNPSWVGTDNGTDSEGNAAFSKVTGWQPAWTLGAGVRQTLGQSS